MSKKSTVAKMTLTPLAAPRGGLLTMPEAARYLGISVGTLYNWVSMKRLAYVKIGSKTHFRQSALDAFIDAHTVPAAKVAQ